MGRITPDDVRKVAALARLDLPESKIATYTAQLERILDYVGHLQQVDTEGVAATTRAVEVPNVTRPDAVEATTIREELLNLAPSGRASFTGCRRSSGKKPEPGLAAGRHGRAVQQLQHSPPRMAGGHERSQGPQTAAATLVAAHTQKEVVEKIQGITAGFKQTEALRRSLGIQ